jgi:hypothetical protein
MTAAPTLSEAADSLGPFCTVVATRDPEFTVPAAFNAPIDFAERLVIELLRFTNLDQALDPRTLKVIIGEGNWISFDCGFWQHLERKPEAVVSVLPPVIARKILRLARAPQSRAWFRTATCPSLHYFVYLDDGRLKMKGHVDAAAPLVQPLTHFIDDYLPSHGIGTHPTPEQLWLAHSSNGK